MQIVNLKSQIYLRYVSLTSTDKKKKKKKNKHLLVITLQM